MFSSTWRQMRSSACALALCLASFATLAAAPAAPVVPPATPAAIAAPASPAAAAATAARHAKRVKCRQQALRQKIKKTDRLEFVKRCLAAP